MMVLQLEPLPGLALEETKDREEREVLKGWGPLRPNAHGLSLVPGGDGILSSPRHIYDSRGIVHLLSLPVFSIWCQAPC